uniref:Uncharacterized protein n=1 Tax=Anguilla anguilla TaxID=7936 RepID=A0A0E9U7M6_ANGAN
MEVEDLGKIIKKENLLIGW